MFADLIVDACLRLGYTTVAITTLTSWGLGPAAAGSGLGADDQGGGHHCPFVEILLYADRAGARGIELDLGFNLIADGLREMSRRD